MYPPGFTMMSSTSPERPYLFLILLSHFASPLYVLDNSACR